MDASQTDLSITDSNIKRHIGDLEQERSQNKFDGRTFALIMILIASLYIIMVICQAFIKNGHRMSSSAYDSIEYEYETTDSYDYRPYLSYDTENQQSDLKGFKYNHSFETKDGEICDFQKDSFRTDENMPDSASRLKEIRPFALFSNKKTKNISQNPSFHDEFIHTEEPLLIMDARGKRS